MLGVLEEEAGRSSGRPAEPSEDLWGYGNRLRDPVEEDWDTLEEQIEASWNLIPSQLQSSPVRRRDASPEKTVANLQQIMGGSWQFG